jgi:ferritin heavy chain
MASSKQQSAQDTQQISHQSHDSLVRQNFDQECERGLNKAANMAMYASYCFHSMCAYFRRDDKALPGFADYFDHLATEKYIHYAQCLTYLLQRGGRPTFDPVDKPHKDEWGSGCDALVAALDIQKNLNKAAVGIHDIAYEKKDYHFSHMINKMMTDQVATTKKLGDYITQCKKVGTGQGEWEFDKLLARCYDRVELGKQAVRISLMSRTLGPRTYEELAGKLGDVKFGQKY